MGDTEENPYEEFLSANPDHADLQPHDKLAELFANYDIAQVTSALNTDVANGLKSSDIPALQEKYGKNVLPPPEMRTSCQRFVDQLKDPLVILLIIAAIVAFALAIATNAKWDEFIPPVFIIIIVSLIAALGMIVEGKADDAVAKLEKASSVTFDVKRDGIRNPIDVKEIVPGDILFFNTGDVLPADVRIVESQKLEMKEAILTGEPVPIKKAPAPKAFGETLGPNKILLPRLEKSPTESSSDVKSTTDVKIKVKSTESLQTRSAEYKCSIGWKGSDVAGGTGTGIVISTGKYTWMGEIAASLADQEGGDTPLQEKLGRLGFYLGLASIAVSLVVFLVGVFGRRGLDPSSDQPAWMQMLLIAVSLTVAAVPEGLPVAVTIALALGMGKMANAKARVKRMMSVETLGSASVICSDKTGTLTKGEMSVVEFFAGSQSFIIEGCKGYEPVGSIVPAVDNNLEAKQLLFMCGLCNGVESNLTTKKVEQESANEETGGCCGCFGGSKKDENLSEKKQSVEVKVWGDGGNMTDGALRCLFTKSQMGEDVAVDGKGGTKIQHTNPFDSSRKMMSSVVSMGKVNPFPGNLVILVKGAPNIILDLCTHITIDGKVHELTPAKRTELTGKVDEWSGMARRVIAFGYSLTERPIEELKEGEADTMEKDLVFVGLTAIIDPARPEVAPAIVKCKQGGVQVRMITGDYLLTAVAIARSVGILAEGEEQFMDCANFRKLAVNWDHESDKHPPPPSDLIAIIQNTRVFARAQPADKLVIVKVLQHLKHVVSMTGDGVNDSPALKHADIGVAMGTGTEAAKAAGDMTLEDDSFATIVVAIEEGRRIYANISKFVYFLMSTNVAEVFVLLLASIVGVQAPLVPVQILWLNLMTDSLPALALADEIAETFIMSRPPTPREANIITPLMTLSIAIHTVVLTATVLGAYFWGLDHYTGSWDGEPDDFENFDNWSEDLQDEYGKRVRKAQTMVIFSIVFAELLRGYTCRSLTASLWSQGPFTNRWMQYSVFSAILLTFLVGIIPGVQTVFGMESLDGESWGIVIGFSILPPILDEILKAVYRALGYDKADVVTKAGQVRPEGGGPGQ
jgi:Ca2+-transporting ATPase